MNKKQIVFLAGVIYAASVHAEELSFRKAAELLIQNNPVLAQRKLQSDAAREQRDQGRAGYYPQIEFLQNWSRSNNPVYVFGTLLNQRQFTEANFAIESLNHPDPLSDVSSKFQLGWLLYDFGGREGKLGAANSGYRIARLSEQAAKTLLFQELVRRYYGVSLAKQRLETAEENLRSAESRWNQARDRVETGLAVETEVLSASVFLARRKQENLDAENGLQLTQSALKELLGTEVGAVVDTASLQERDFEEKPLDLWKEQMKQNRPELQIAFEVREMASSQVTSSRAAFLPSIQAWSAYEWHGDSLSYTGSNWGAGLELRWNLFHGFSDSSQYSLARIREKESVEKQRETENALVLQLESAFYRFQNAKEKLKVASAVQTQAQENRRIYAERYAAGLANIQDSLQAEAVYGESRFLYLQNTYDLYVAHAELLAAAGLPEIIVSGEMQ